MGNVVSNHACFPEPWVNGSRPTVIVVVILIVGVVLLPGQGEAVLIAVVSALLGAVAQEVVRAAVRSLQQEI